MVDSKDVLLELHDLVVPYLAGEYAVIDRLMNTPKVEAGSNVKSFRNLNDKSGIGAARNRARARRISKLEAEKSRASGWRSAAGRGVMDLLFGMAENPLDQFTHTVLGSSLAEGLYQGGEAARNMFFPKENVKVLKTALTASPVKSTLSSFGKGLVQGAKHGVVGGALGAGIDLLERVLGVRGDWYKKKEKE